MLRLYGKTVYFLTVIIAVAVAIIELDRIWGGDNEGEG